MPLYAKMDCALDSSPKIRKAGRDGREVFLFLLRRNRLLDAGGFLPPGDIDPDYLADQLMMPAEAASEGVARCIEAALLSIVDTESNERVTAETLRNALSLRSLHGKKVAIVGWSDEWSREPKSNAERQAAFRRKQKENELLKPVVHSERNGPKVTDNGSNVREEKRREEKNKRERVCFSLWDFQNQLRREAIPGARDLAPAKKLLKRVSDRVSEFGEENCRLVLETYAKNAKSSRESAKFFDGVTNWRVENFTRALSRGQATGIGTNAAKSPTMGPAVRYPEIAQKYPWMTDDQREAYDALIHLHGVTGADEFAENWPREKSAAS